jgi:hypothetical protein
LPRFELDRPLRGVDDKRARDDLAVHLRLDAILGHLRARVRFEFD